MVLVVARRRLGFKPPLSSSGLLTTQKSITFRWHVQTCRLNFRLKNVQTVKQTNSVEDVFSSNCRDVIQQPTANNNNNHHNHGPHRRKWPSSAPHEAFRPTLMPWINRWQPPKQVDMFIIRIGRVYPSRRSKVGTMKKLPPAAAGSNGLLSPQRRRWVSRHCVELIG